MNRRSFVSGMSVVGASAYLFHIQPAEEQIADLQDDVTALDERVSALETEVAGSGDNSEVPNSSSDSAEGVAVQGTGTTVSDKFTLGRGQYRVNATLDIIGDFEGFTVFVYDPSGNDELLFNEIIQQSGLWEGSAVYDAGEDGDYFVGVENTSSAWTLTFEPF